MQAEWIKIFTTSSPVEAEIVRAMLEENEIDAVEMNKQDSNLIFGNIDLYCPSHQVMRARQLINPL
jgi:hypothetical protein